MNFLPFYGTCTSGWPGYGLIFRISSQWNDPGRAGAIDIAVGFLHYRISK